MTEKIILQDAFKGYTVDQDKVIAPEETVRRFRRRLESLDLKILEQTLRIDKGRLDIPVYFSYCGKDAADLTGTKKQMGKGATATQAEASAVMELAERFSFFSFVKNEANFTVGTYREVAKDALPFEMIARSVHDESDELDQARRIFEELPLKWARAYNLTRDQSLLVPFDWFYAINEFNGPSAGNCVEEALSQGICEIVERHVSSLVSRGRLRLPAVDPDSVRDPAVREMLTKYRKAGIELYLTDFSLDTGIPTVGALAYDPTTFPEKSEIVWTAGTTPGPEKAVSRALTEVAQLAGDFNSGSNYVASGLPKFTRLEDAAFVVDAPRMVRISEMPDLSNDNIRIEVENLIAALADRSFEVLVLDTRHPQLQVPAFYTIVPGAHFRERAQGTSVGMFCAKLLCENLPPQAAIEHLQRFEQTLPGKYYLSFYLGSSYLALGKPEAALQHFRQALDRRPPVEEMVTIYSYSGICYKEMGQYRRALEVLREGEAMDRERTDIHNLKGFCYFKLKQHEQALRCFKKVIALDPTSAIDYANIASNYRDLGDSDQAIRYYVMALELDPTLSFARESLERLMEGTA
ncbi:MAG TPA: YcaO-like family protein [Desulfobacterales bacterium]